MDILNNLIKNKWLRKNYFKLRIRLGFLFALFLLIVAQPPFCYVGIIISLFGVFYRSWASGYLLKNKELIQSGPYKLSRHPLYFGSFLIGLGIVVFVNNIFLIVLYLLMFSTIYYLTIKIEEDKLKKIFYNDYELYCKKTNCFIPDILKLNRDIFKSWHIKNYIKNREYRELLGYIGMYFLIYLKILILNQ